MKQQTVSKKIKYNIILENILDKSDVNLNHVERTTQLLISNLNDRYLDYKINFNYVDVDTDVQNKIYTSFSALAIGNYVDIENKLIENIGNGSIGNLRKSLYFDKNLKDYAINSINFEIIKITEKVEKTVEIS